MSGRSVVLVVLALLGLPACAGEVGQYRNAVPDLGVDVPDTRPGPGGPAPASVRETAPASPGSAAAGSGATTTGLTKDTVKVGVFYPRTGPLAAIFRNTPAVARAAAAEAGPVNGRRLVFEFFDDGTSNAGQVQVEERRAKDDAFTLVSIISETNVVLAPLAEQHRIPLVVGNIDQRVAEPLTWTFPVFTYWARMASLLPGFVKTDLGGADKAIGVVYEGGSTAIDAKAAFKAAAEEVGLRVVFEQPIAQNQSSCANEASNLKARGVELVFLMNGPRGAICMLRDAAALGYRPIWTGVGASWTNNVVAAATGGGAEGVRALSTATTLETPAGRHFSALLRRGAPDSAADRDDTMLVVYGLLRSAIEALRRAGPDLTRETLLRAWETKMNGYDSGYLPPPTFGPGNRSGPLLAGVTACCTDGRWTTPQPGWRAAF
jgi:branched-chain amino acid transport system substrate-binding protein